MQLNITYVPVSELKAYAGNARVHGHDQIEQLARSIRQFGFNVPVLAKADGTIIAGHGRVEAARVAGLDQVPVIRIEHLTEDQVKAFTLADNKIALNARWDFEKLSAELSALSESGLDLEVTGFDERELDDLLASVHAILPEQRWEADLVPVVPTVQVSQIPAPHAGVAAPAPVAVAPAPAEKPTASGDSYSNFEILMLHANKVELVERLSEVRKTWGYPKLEDALMHVVRAYREE